MSAGRWIMRGRVFQGRVFAGWALAGAEPVLSAPPKPRKSQQIIIKHDSPSFENGFAPRDGEALYPNLLKGLVGAWCPSLGITGGILRDVSGRNNHGALTNMDPATDWVIDGGKGALDFDGVNDYVEVQQVNLATSFTISFWMKSGDINQSQKYIISRVSAGDNDYSIIYGYASQSLEFYSGRYSGTNPRTYSAIVINDTNWHYITYSYSPGEWSGYLDGIRVFNNSATFTLTMTSGAFFGFSTFDRNSRFFDGRLDDIKIRNRCLIADEVITEYQLGRGGAYKIKPVRYLTTTPARIPNSRSSLITRPPAEPSYESGYAPRDGESLYPNLFNGLAGAWCPSMGVTGNALRDLSGRGNHGVFTNMNPTTAWDTYQGQYALNFTNADGQPEQYIDAGTMQSEAFNYPFSMMCWVRNATPGDRPDTSPFSKTSTVTGYAGPMIWINGGVVNAYWAGGIKAAGTTIVSSRLDWYQLGICWTGNQAQAIVNGRINGVGNTTSPPNAANQPINIGRYFAGGNRTMTGQVDDCAIWRRCLTPQEWQQLYQLGRGGMFRFKPQTARKTISLPATWLKAGDEWTEVQPKIATGSKASLITRPPIEPSYGNGFAPRDGEPLYLNLFKGLVGAWCPSMGVTGSTLRDLSGQNNHGTLTNMDPATDWVIDNGQYALDFDGSNDDVSASVPAGIAGATSLSYSLWWRRKTISVLGPFFGVGVASSENNRFVFQAWSDTQVYISTAASTWGNFTSNDLLWHHIVISYDGNGASNATRLQVYFDGRPQTLSFTGTISAAIGTPTLLRIGRTISNDYGAGIIDDMQIRLRTASANEAAQLYQLGRGGLFTLKPKTIALPTSTIWQPSQSRLYTGDSWK